MAGSLNQVLSPSTPTTSTTPTTPPTTTLVRSHLHPSTSSLPHHQTVLVPSFQPVFNLYSYWQQQQHYYYNYYHEQQQQKHNVETDRPQQPTQFGDHQQGSMQMSHGGHHLTQLMGSTPHHHHHHHHQMAQAAAAAAAAGGSPVAAPGAGAGASTPSAMGGGANAPCSTLFIANLGQFVSEQELKELFGSFPGYCRLRMHNKGGAPVAFVEYADVRCAAQALISLQGTYLLSSDRGGVRIEYARNKMAETGGGSGSNNGGSPTSGASSSSSLLSMANGQQQEQKYNLHHHQHTQAEVEAAKMSSNQASMAMAAAAANSALSQAVQGAPLHALGLYGHHIWLGMQD